VKAAVQVESAGRDGFFRADLVACGAVDAETSGKRNRTSRKRLVDSSDADAKATVASARHVSSPSWRADFGLFLPWICLFERKCLGHREVPGVERSGRFAQEREVLVRELQAVKARIGVRTDHELGMRATFTDLAVSEDQDLVGRANGSQAMGDDKGGAGEKNPISGWRELFGTNISDSASSSRWTSSR